MPATPLTDVAQRLLANVEQDHGDLAPGIMRLPTTNYTDPAMYQREIEQIFHKVPLAVALTVDIPNAGDYLAYDIAGRPIVVVLVDDGVPMRSSTPAAIVVHPWCATAPAPPGG